MGSVKDLKILESPTEEKPGIGRFIFSDRYSVFDWGEMPDKIVNKGKSICVVTAYFFEILEKNGINTHYRGILEDGVVKKLSELKSPQDVMEFNLVRVIKPEIKENKYDYSVYKKERTNFLIPLEIIYRNSLPKGSSIFRRLKEGKIKPEALGLSEIPKPGTVLKNPFLDVSTKLEKQDRYITWEEAKEISGLSDDEIDKIRQITLFIDNLITKEVKKIGLFNEDGKVEFGFNERRELMVVDALGTLDECRFTYQGIPVSKEVARIYYRGTGWYKEVEEAKKKDNINWRDYVKNVPPPLPDEFVTLISYMYQAYANEITGREFFDVPPLKEILENIKEFVE